MFMSISPSFVSFFLEVFPRVIAVTDNEKKVKYATCGKQSGT